MSKHKDIQCPCCGIQYDDFRTGLTFADVRGMLWVESENSEDWKYKRRHTVLGLWHSIKLAQWDTHIDECLEMAEAVDRKDDFAITTGLEY